MGRLIPVQDLPDQAGQVFIDGSLRQILKQRSANSLPAKTRPHKEIFQVDSSTSMPGRVVIEEKRKARRFAVPFGNDALETAVGAKAIAQEILFTGDYSVGLTLIFRQLTDQGKNEARVGGNGATNIASIFPFCACRVVVLLTRQFY